MTIAVDQLSLPDGRRISYIRLEPAAQAPHAQVSQIQTETVKRKPEVMWLGGFRSSMRGGKADALHAWCETQGLGFTRFDYSGHGETGGDFETCTISQWLEEAEAVFHQLTKGPVIFIGSSMGAWLTLLLMRRATKTYPDRIRGAVFIAPAWDMTERLMWGPAPDDIKAELTEKGVWYRPSAYDDEPYPITWKLIEDGRAHLIGGAPFDPGAPVRILHGLLDVDVPWAGSIELASLLKTDDVRITLVKDAEHRLGRDQDLALLMRDVAELAG